MPTDARAGTVLWTKRVVYRAADVRRRRFPLENGAVRVTILARGWYGMRRLPRRNASSVVGESIPATREATFLNIPLCCMHAQKNWRSRFSVGTRPKVAKGWTGLLEGELSAKQSLDSRSARTGARVDGEADVTSARQTRGWLRPEGEAERRLC